MDKLNVAIADDNAKMTDMLGQMIEEDKDLELVGKAHNGEEICNIIKDKEPDVVILRHHYAEDGRPFPLWRNFPIMQMSKKFQCLSYYLQLDRRGLQRMHSVLEQTIMF